MNTSNLPSIPKPPNPPSSCLASHLPGRKVIPIFKKFAISSLIVIAIPHKRPNPLSTLTPFASHRTLILTLFAGAVYDAHSTSRSDDGAFECTEGLTCYRTAYWMTFAASLFGVAISLISIFRHKVQYEGYGAFGWRKASIAGRAE
jgi:hypothetical protein